MISLLDKFSVTPVPVRPNAAEDLFGMLLASKLQDGQAARHYTELCNRYPRDHLLAAYRRTMAGFHPGNDLGRSFHRELEKRTGRGQGNHEVRLVAFHLERRSIAAAILDGDRLTYTQIRQLSSDRERVVGSAAGFIHGLLQQFEPDSVAIETVRAERVIQRLTLYDTVRNVIRKEGLPLWEVDKRTLLEAYGAPRLRSRRQLRDVIRAIWPDLPGTTSSHFVQDAAALGLYVQTERLFLH